MRLYAKTICGGFTLIELLVVIAVISLIASILLPSLLRAKELAREVVCLSNARNIGVLMQYYAQDHGYRLPVPWDQDLDRSRYYSWPVALGAYITENASLIQNEFPMSASFQPDMVVKCFQCPTLLGVHPATKNTYVMNNYTSFSDPDCFFYGLNLEAVQDPHRRIAIGEGAFSYQSGGACFADTFLRVENVGFYHNGGEITGLWKDWLGPQYEQTDGWGTLLMVDGRAVAARPGEVDATPQTGEGPYFTTPY
ncbi:MAG: type II secretion system protein [Phycisphaerae bacterium]|nr:type II secretion system protein [Phycisphaerae bacterium]